jgi:ribose 1,5-bisphosphokinase
VTAGTFVCVVGPSGAGKDTLIRGAQHRLAGDERFVFPRRLVTRPVSGDEDHDVIAPEIFERMSAERGFALSWTAHGLGYAIPLEAMRGLARGAVVTCNLSRRAVPEARARLGDVVVVLVTAPRDVLARRLEARGRETREEIAVRLDRDVGTADLMPDVTIDNVGDVISRMAQFAAFLEGLAAATRP